MSEKWTKLLKTSNAIYKLTPEKPTSKKCESLSFDKISFNKNGDRLVAVDTKGIAHLIEFISNSWMTRKLGYIGHPTLISFNPLNKLELIIGLTSGEIKIYRFANSLSECHSTIHGHESSPTWISFYKNYYLTSSKKTAIICNLEFYIKLREFRVKNTESCIKKSLISPTGLILTLYDNDDLHVWRFASFDLVTKIHLPDYGMKVVKDFIFTVNGRAVVCCSVKKIFVFNTTTWTIIRSFELAEPSSLARKLIGIPQGLNPECGNVVGIIFGDGLFRLFDLMTSMFIESIDANCPKGIRKNGITSSNQWISWIEYDGTLNIINCDRLTRPKVVKIKSAAAKPRIGGHDITQHLKYVQQSLAKSLNIENLKPILQEFGEYPERHRAIIWRTLMKLPSNRQAFLGLSSKVSNDFKDTALKNFQLADKTKETLLTLTTDCLIQLFPFLQHSYFLPELIFPFLIVLQNNPLHAYEAVLTVLLNFCQKWFEYHPFPPLNVLGIIENILIEVDPDLMKFYFDNGVTSTQYAWPILRTLMSEVLSGTEWLILWDHLLTYRQPVLLLMCVVAYNICSRKAIFLLEQKKENIERFFGQQGHLRARDVFKMALKLNEKVSDKNHPSQYLRNKFYVLPRDGPYPTILSEQYPRFLIEHVDKMDELRMWQEDEETIRKKCLQKALIAEQNRIKDETEDFLQQVHRQRVKEFGKCYGQQVHSLERLVNNEKNRLRKKFTQSRKICKCPKTLSNLCKCSRSVEDVFDKGKYHEKMMVRGRAKSVEKLQEDVRELEEEVDTFLEILKYNR